MGTNKLCISISDNHTHVSCIITRTTFVCNVLEVRYRAYQYGHFTPFGNFMINGWFAFMYYLTYYIIILQKPLLTITMKCGVDLFICVKLLQMLML